MKSFVALRSRALFVIALAVSVGACATAGTGDDPAGDDGGTATGDDASGGDDSTADSGSYNTPDTGTGTRDGAASSDSGQTIDSGGTHLDSGAPLDSGSAPDSATQSCNGSTCASGCCSGNTCITATGDSQCGQNGVVCIDCTASSETCSQGLCGTTGTGDPNCDIDCNGCCDANNVCQAGTSNAACGAFGETCAPCSLCLDGVCL